VRVAGVDWTGAADDGKAEPERPGASVKGLI
jgi:hypothetical protein